MKTPTLSDSTTRRSAALSTLWAMLDAPEQGDSPQASTSDSGKSISSWTCGPAATNGLELKYLPSSCKSN